MQILSSQEKLSKWTAATEVQHSFYSKNWLYTTILSSIILEGTQSSSVTECYSLFAF